MNSHGSILALIQLLGRRGRGLGERQIRDLGPKIRLNESLEALRLVDGDDRILDRDPAFFAKLAEGAGDRFAGGTRHRRHLFVGEEERETEGAAVEVLADLMAQLKEQAAKAGGHGFSEGDAASILKGKSVFLADALDSAHLGFLVCAEEAEESLALYGAQLGGGEGLSGDFIDTVRENSVEAEHGTGTRDADDHLAVLGAAGGELDVSGADEVEAAGFIALGKEGCLAGQGNGGCGQFEIGKDGASQRAEPSRAAVGARCTTDRRLPVDGFLAYLRNIHLL